MKFLMMLWFVVGFTCLGNSQTLTINDDATGEPIELVSIYSSNPRAFATTNAKGQAEISGFKGAESIHIQCMGYKVVQYSFDELKQQGFLLKLSPINIQMEEIIVSATRWNRENYESPYKIESITAKDVSLLNPQTAADLLGASGKVFIQKSQQGGGSPMIRGFATNRLMYSVDGVRMNNAIFRAGNIQNVISLDPLAIERSEVLFGPGSVIYGSDAIGGVMSFTTINPQFSLTDKPLITGKAVTRFASVNKENSMHMDVNVGWQKWAMVSSISYNKYDHLRMGSNGPDQYLNKYRVQRQDSTDVVVTNEDPQIQNPSGYEQINLMQKIAFKPNEHWRFNLAYHYSETSSYGRYDRHQRTRNGLPRYAEWDYGPQVWSMTQFTTDYKGKHLLFDEMKLNLAYQNFEESRISRDLNSNSREIREETVAAYSANLDFTKTRNKHEIYYGLEAVSNDVNSKGIDEDIVSGAKVLGPSRYPNSVWRSYAAYLSDNYHLTSSFSIVGGLRFNIVELDATFDNAFYSFPFSKAELSNNALTGNLGFIYRPQKDLVLSFTGATAFRSPNVDDIGKVFDSEPGAVVVPNPNLKHEYAYNLDFGLTKLFGESVKLELSVFYTQLQNALVRRNYQLNGQDSINYDGTLSQVQAIQNAAQAQVYGVQAGVEIKLGAGFVLSSDYSYQKGEEEMDDGSMSSSRHAAPGFGVTRISYNQSKLNLQLYANYSEAVQPKEMPVSEAGKTEIYAINANGETFAPAWGTLNFKVRYQFTQNFTLSGGVENITDERYRPYSSGLVAPGRNVILSLIAKF